MIDFNNVSKLLGGRDIFKNVSFRINSGERVGVVGPNGAGKTTLFSLIDRENTPDKGEVVTPRAARIGYLKQQLAFFREDLPLLAYVKDAGSALPAIRARIHEIESELSSPGASGTSRNDLLDELGRLQTSFEHLGGYEMEHRAAAALAGLGFKPADLQKPMGSFSGGWQMRASMARVLLGEPDILLLDEPSNYLDIPAVEWLRKSLRTYEGTLLLISHDRFLLNSLTSVTLEINGGAVTRYPGNYTYYAQERVNRKIQADAERKNNEKKKQTLQDNINRFRAKATKAAQVQSWIKMLDKLKEVEIPEDLHFQGRITIPEPPRCGQEVVRLEDVSLSYDGVRKILDGVSLSVDNGDKIGIVGYNGMGKTTLLRIVAGRLPQTSGTRKLGHNVILGYQAQEFAELLPPELSAFDVVRDAASALDVSGQRIREILGAFGFSGEAALKPCRVLSGGEKIRLCFARIFVNPPNLLILDEPTTHLDISAREALQDAIRRYPGTVCLVSHDVEFLRGSASNILEITPSGVRRHYGGYDDYREKILREQNENERVIKSVTIPSETMDESVNSKERRREKAQRRHALLPEKKRLEHQVKKLENAVEHAETERAKLLEMLMSPQTAGTDFSVLQKRLKDLEYAISRDTLAWEEAAAEWELFRKEYEEI